jgi:hypothetical protein
MKRGYSRFRTSLMAFSLGLAAVYMWQGLSFAWWGVPVDLPEARSASILEVTVPLEGKPPEYLCDEFTDENDRASCLKQLIFEGRDISLYDDGGRVFTGCDDYPSYCKKPLAKARRFVWEHWKKHKRGHITVVSGNPERVWARHLFIEPNAEGRWVVVERTVPMLRERSELRLDDLIEIKWKRATADDERFGVTRGTLFLWLDDITGNSLIL